MAEPNNGDDEFLVEGLWADDEETKVRLIFENKDVARRSVTLRRSSIPSLISLLQTKIEAGSVTPIRPDSVFVGQSFAIDAFQTIRKPDGSMQLVFFLRLPDENNRGVTFPVNLTPAEAAEIAKALCQT
jgi:hypothetical protein